MKILRKTLLIGLVILIVSLAVPAVRDALHWAYAKHHDSIGQYARYLADRPEGAHTEQAARRVEELRWEQAKAVHTIPGYLRYLEPSRAGRFEEAAREAIEVLRSDAAPLDAALAAGSVDALHAFLEDHPGHAMEAQARTALKTLKAGTPIAELLASNSIEVETRGQDITMVTLRVRNPKGTPVRVRIPAGTYLVSERKAAQNMVTTETAIVRLTDASWRDVSIPAACANRRRAIPGKDDRFALKAQAPNDELVSLMAVLGQEAADRDTVQAAVWVVTDDASFDELGILIRSGAGRVIGANEAVGAMRYCAQAGIDLRQKRIWKDRIRIRTRVTSEAARRWVDENVETYLEAVQGDRAELRKQALQGLHGQGDAEAIAALIQVLKDESRDVRGTAADYLGRLKAEAAVEPLIELLDDEYYGPRQKAAISLGLIGDPRAIEPLIAMLESKARGYPAAAYALSMVGDERAVMPLIRSLEKEDFEIRQYAAIALGKLGDPRAIDPLIAIVDYGINSVPEYVSSALAEITDSHDAPRKRKDFIPYWKSYRARTGPPK